MEVLDMVSYSSSDMVALFLLLVLSQSQGKMLFPLVKSWNSWSQMDPYFDILLVILNLELCRESDVRWCWSDKPDGWYLSEYFLWKLCSHCGGECIHTLCQRRIQIVENPFLGFFPNKEQLKTLQCSYFCHIDVFVWSVLFPHSNDVPWSIENF